MNGCPKWMAVFLYNIVEELIISNDLKAKFDRHLDIQAILRRLFYEKSQKKIELRFLLF